MKVLVGEPSYSEFEVLNDFLTARGFAVQWVQTGGDAVAAFQQAAPDLMILDALLPGLTGLKVCQTVRKLPGGEQVKTVLLSKVYRQFKAQYESRRTMGVDAYAEKPVNVGEMDKLLSELLAAAAATPVAEPAPAPSAAAGSTRAAPAPAAATAAPEAPESGETRRKMGAAGALSATPFPRLLFYLFKYRRTGALRVAHEQVSKVLYLREGNLEFVTSNLSNESLGRYLVQRGAITDEQYNSSLQKMVVSGRQQGDILLEMGVLSPHQLFEGLQGQAREKILRVFAWDEGAYEFRSGAFTFAEGLQMKIPTLPLVLEGVRRFYTLSRLERYFNEYKNQRLRRINNSLLDRGVLSLAPRDAKLFKLVDGRMTLGKIVANSHLGLSETFQLLYFLLLTEVVRFVGDPGFGRRGLREHEEYAEGRRQRRDELRSIKDDRVGFGEDNLRVFRRAVARAHENLDQKNYYELLNLTRSATADAVRQAYHRLAKAYRPFELHRQADVDLQAKSDRLFAAISRAYEALIDPETRRAYDDDLVRFPGKPPAPPAPETERVVRVEAPPRRPEPRREAPSVPPSLRADRAVAREPEPPAEQTSAIFHLDDLVPPEPAPAPAAPEPEFTFVDEADFAPAGERVVTEDLDAPDIEWAPEADLAAEAANDTAQELVDFTVDEEEEKSVEEAGRVTASMADLIKSELAFQQGEDALHRKDFDAAQKHFSEAMRLNPREAEYSAYLGFAIFLAHPDDAASVAQGRDLIEKAVIINPTQDTAYTFLGLVQMHDGQREQARRSFERALQYNPENGRARQELRKLEAG